MKSYTCKSNPIRKELDILEYEDIYLPVYNINYFDKLYLTADIRDFLI